MKPFARDRESGGRSCPCAEGAPVSRAEQRVALLLGRRSSVFLAHAGFWGAIEATDRKAAERIGALEREMKQLSTRWRACGG